MARDWSPSSLPSLDGRVYIVTGGSSGIGYHAVHELAKRGAKVYVGCRNGDKGQAAIDKMKQDYQRADLHLLLMDLMSLSSVVKAAKRFATLETHLHGLVNNAGIMATPYEVTQDGYEAQWQTNYLSHWVLTYHLLPILRSTAKVSAPGQVRVVNVSSMGHKYAPAEGINFDDTAMRDAFTFKRYGQSKLGNILLSTSLHELYGPGRSHGKDGEIWSVSLHPGNVDTGLNMKAWGSIMVPALRCFGVYLTPEKGAWNTLWAVAGSEMTAVTSGKYLEPVGKITSPSAAARDQVLAKRLWEWTEKEMSRVVGLS